MLLRLKQSPFQNPIATICFLIVSLALFFLMYSCGQTGKDLEDNNQETFELMRGHTFVGDQTCQSCHAQEWEAWKGSHHDYAIGEADEEHVRGDFDNAEFTQGENSYRFYRNGESYMVDATEQGETETYTIDYTFGWEPLQQYLINIGDGKIQALHIAWDTEKNRWFSLQPDEEYDSDDWMHWTGGSMNWNTMCADCHSTNLKQNYIAEADSFHTSWDVIDVSCEACHGPGGDHVEFVNSPQGDKASPERIREDLNLTRTSSQIEEINTCAPCHSLRQTLTDDYIHGDPYLEHYDPLLPHPENYFADGQIRGEVYVYGSFLQSKMYAEGVTCSDCHDPHTLELKEPLVNNELCMQCHEPQYNTPEHHFHEPNTEQSQCINCHMTGRTYMGNDYRRDHSFRVPRPDQSNQFGTPNACNDCHTDRSAEWAADAVETWYGPDRPDHFSDVLLKANAEQRSDNRGLRELIEDTSEPEIIRATAVWYVGRFPDEDAVDILRDAIESDSPMVRSTAAKAMESFPSDTRITLLENTLSDSVRSVRLAAAQQLAEFALHDVAEGSRDHFENAMQEYRAYLDVNQYFPQGLMNRGQFFEKQGQTDQAIAAYRKALQRDPYFNPARVNLAYLYNGIGENERAEELLRTVIEQEPRFGDAYYSLALLLAEENRMKEAVDYFEQATELLTGNARVFYNLAIAHQTMGNPQQAEAAYKRAIELEPENGDYRYGLTTLYLQEGQNQMALKQAQELSRIYPNNPQIEQLMQVVKSRM